MAIFERRNDWPAALARSVSGGWRVERSCCFARNAAAWRQGKKIANEPLQAKVGERSERIVARDPPAKTATRRVEAALQEGMAHVRAVADADRTALAPGAISPERNKGKQTETKMQQK
ncbi:hypothetical protein Q2941_48165 [Bradyrhizobium sp. UFLA05-153]